MAPTVATRRTRARPTFSGMAFAGSPYARRFIRTCQTGIETLLIIGQKWASARATPWMTLGVAAVFSMLPLRFEADSRLMFEVGAQPPAAIVNGMAQLIGSRELAQDVVQRMSAEDVARLASGSILPFSPAPTQTDAAEAVRKLRTTLTVEPVQGGRGLDITVQASSPALSVRVANAYMNAILELDSQTRAQASAANHIPLPAMRRDGEATGSLIPNLPSPIILMLLSLGAGVVVITRHRRARMEPELRGFVDPDDLPREVNLPRRIIWIDDGSDEGLHFETAISRLESRLLPSDIPPGLGRLYLFSSQGHINETGRCALQFSRRLAERDDVAVVFLEDVPVVAEAFEGALAPEGLHDVLGGKSDFPHVLRRDPKSRADIIRAGRMSAAPLSSGQERHLGTLLNVLQQAYAHVVVFAPEIGKLPSSVTSLNPVAICIMAAETPAAAAVEQCDALAARNLKPVVVMRLAIDLDAEKRVVNDGLPLPTLDAVARPHAALPAPGAHYGPGWPYPELVRAA